MVLFSPQARQHVGSVESSSLIHHVTFRDFFYRDDSLTSKEVTMRTEQLTTVNG